MAVLMCAAPSVRTVTMPPASAVSDGTSAVTSNEAVSDGGRSNSIGVAALKLVHATCSASGMAASRTKNVESPGSRRGPPGGSDAATAICTRWVTSLSFLTESTWLAWLTSTSRP